MQSILSPHRRLRLVMGLMMITLLATNLTRLSARIGATPAAAQDDLPGSEAPQAIAYNALALAGTEGYVRVPNSSELNNLSAITIEAWVYRNTTNRGETILGNGWTESYWLGFSPTGKLRFIAHGGGDIVDSNGTVYSGKWTHVAATYNGSVRNFYINGVLDRTTTESPGSITPNDSDPLGIGYDADPFSGNYFDGILDEVRLWNKVRSPAEIQAGMFQNFSSTLPASLIGYWRLNGNSNDETGDHDGALQGGLGSSSWVYDGVLPKDIRIPQVSNPPTLDGRCTLSEYTNSVGVGVEGVTIYLQHTATDLWACFDFYVDASYTRASLLIDPNHDRLDPAQPDDLRFDVYNDDSLAAYVGNDAGQWVITDTFDTLWDGDYHITSGEFPIYTAEFRLASELTGGWGHVVGLALDPYIPGIFGYDMAGIWPALAVNTQPSTWSSATLAGIGPTRTFSGSVLYQPKDPAVDPSGVNGARVELYGYDPGGSEALAAVDTTGPSGSFSLTTNDDFSQHRLELVQLPQGYNSLEAEAPAPGEVLDPRSIDYGDAAGGDYPDNVFTLGDITPGYTAAPYGPVFLILAPQAVIDDGALEAFRSFKIGQGYAVSLRAVEETDDYPGATRLERIRALEQEYLATYGNRFQFVMLVGPHEVIPFARITPYATGEGPVCPGESPVNYKYSDWLYVDLTSDWDSNNNGCYADGTLQSPSKLVSGYIRDTGIAFDPTVVVGRLPFTDSNEVRQALQNSIGFEKQSESFKLKALNGMSMLALKGYFYGSPCTNNWGDHCVNPAPNDQTNYDTALLSEEMMDDFLSVNGFDTTILYENEEEIAGGQGIHSPSALTLNAVRTELDDGRFGLATMTGHGNSTGVYRNFWSSDKNGNGVVDVRDDSQTELSEVTFFSVSGVLDQISPDGSRGSVFVLLACSNASPTNASSLAATILTDGHGPASVAALSVVTVGSWFDEGDGNAESIGYYVNKRLVSNGYRLGESVWWTMADLVRDGNSGSGGVAYDLYGDPTLSFFGNPGGQSTQAAWPMGRRDATGSSILSLPGPTYPKQLWEYTAGPHAADTLGPTPLVSNNGEVIVASGQYVDVLRQGALHQRLSLDASVFGSPALSADGTIYVMDQNATLYAFPYQRFTLNNYTWITDERYRRWSVDLGENPQASPIVGADGFILAGVGGPYASDPRLWLVRPDGEAFSSFVLAHNPLYYAATDASRTAYVATGVVSPGHLYRFTQFCDTSMFPDVCPYPFWDEMTIDVAFNTPPLLAYGSLYIGDVVGNLYKINPATLDIQATFTADSAIKLGPVTSPNGDVVFITNQGVMYSLTKTLTTVRWQKNLGYTSLGGIPATSSNAIYLAFDGYLRAYNPNSGAQLWKRSLGEEIGYASVSVGYGREVYVQGVDGTVLAFSEGWGFRPARLTVSAGVSAGGIRQFMRLEIAQSIAPISSTLQTETPTGSEPAEPQAPTADIVAVLLQRSENGGAWEDLALLDPAATVYTDTHVMPDTTYAYRVQNLMSDGQYSDFETTLETVQSLPDAPGAPTLSPVSVQSAEALALEWSAAPGSLVENFRVERAEDAGGPFTPVITVTGATTALVDAGLTPGTTYYYRLAAVNASGESNASNVASGTTRSQTLAAPQNVAATLDGNAITITWDDGPSGATAVLEVLVFGTNETTPLGSAAADGSYVFYTGEPNAYAFRVKFVLGEDESAWSSSPSVLITPASQVYLPLVMK